MVAGPRRRARPRNPYVFAKSRFARGRGTVCLCYDEGRPCGDRAGPRRGHRVAGPAVGLPAGYQAIVVDNGSTDGSAEVAARAGASVVREDRRGFGAGCWAGLMAADPPDGVVCFMDGDGSLDPADVPRVADAVLAGDADLVIAAHRPTVPRAWPPHARVANAVLAWQLRRRAGLPPRDIGPMRAARCDGMRSLGLRDRRSGWPLEMVLRAAAAGWRVREVSVSYAPRAGRSKVTGTLGGTVQAVRDMRSVLRERGLNASLKASPDRRRTDQL
jgi:Glycosyl transferase family 2